jgi:hypothetical protein
VLGCRRQTFREDFIRGTWMPVMTTLNPASTGTASIAAVNLESRSRMRKLAL